MNFYDLTQDEQVAGLIELARVSLPEWELEGAALKLVAYRENTTLSVVTSGGEKYALRVHQAGYRTDQEVMSEIAFTRELEAHGIHVPSLVNTAQGTPFVYGTSGQVPEPRRLALFEWIDGTALRVSGGENELPEADLKAAYRSLGRQGGLIQKIGSAWTVPKDFSRPVWDEEGIFGERAHLGDFRKLRNLTDQQLKLFLEAADKAKAELQEFGKTPDRFGLVHGDFLPDNVFVAGSGIKLLDFDDCGTGWYLFEYATALLDLVGQPTFDVCLEAVLDGHREEAPLPQEHLALMPAFVVARALSYLGWVHSRAYTDWADDIASFLIPSAEALARDYMK